MDLFSSENLANSVRGKSCVQGLEVGCCHLETQYIKKRLTEFAKEFTFS